LTLLVNVLGLYKAFRISQRALPMRQRSLVVSRGGVVGRLMYTLLGGRRGQSAKWSHAVFEDAGLEKEL
jgi:hypothetical protein